MRCFPGQGLLAVLAVLLAVRGGGAEVPAERRLAVEGRREVVLPLSVVGGIACPYSAAWMADMNLFMKAKFYLTEPKMEEASFAVFRKVKKLYQVTKFEDFHVLHMSAFEHGVSKLEGFEKAELKTDIYSDACMKHECSSFMDGETFNFSHHDTSSVAFVPFYSKKPAGTVVNKRTNKMKVTSIGQGNSLVNPNIKIKQLLSTICSILKYFEYVVVGVTGESEKDFVSSVVSNMHANKLVNLSSRIAIKVFQIPKPALLPFYLLNWGQWAISQRNCNALKLPTEKELHPYCADKLWSYPNDKNFKWSMPLSVSGKEFAFDKPISVVYYSESDSILLPKNVWTMRSLILVLSAHTIVTPIRVEKNPRSDPSTGSLTSDLVLARNPCGKPLCTLNVSLSQKDWSISYQRFKYKLTCTRNISAIDKSSKKKGRGFKDAGDGGNINRASRVPGRPPFAAQQKYMEKLQLDSITSLMKATA